MPTYAITRFGFLDASARMVLPPQYAEYDYCQSGARPSRVVAARDGAIDVLALDGTVNRTITTARGSEDANGVTFLWCLGNKTVVLARLDPETNRALWQRVFDVSTGKKLPPLSLKALDALWNAPDPNPCPADKPIPASDLGDFLADVGGGWAEAIGNTYVNVNTGASVTPPDWLVGSDADDPVGGCSGYWGFLSCGNAQLSVVYDKFGSLTPFQDVGTAGDAVGCVVSNQPYQWATAGNVRGYVDADGAWHYQEQVYTTIKD